MENSVKDIIALLNETYMWPAPYPFKFIVFAEQVDELKQILGDDVEIKLKPSSAGRYVSVSADIILHSAQAVLDIYEKTKVVKGIRSL